MIARQLGQESRQRQEAPVKDSCEQCRKKYDHVEQRYCSSNLLCKFFHHLEKERAVMQPSRGSVIRRSTLRKLEVKEQQHEGEREKEPLSRNVVKECAAFK